MKRKEFLEELNEILTKRNYADKEEVVKDFEEHFIVGEQEGKSEEEIARLLGSPKDIADQFKEEIEEEVVSEKETTEKTGTENSAITKLVLTIMLIFFNVTFGIGLVAGLFGTLFGLFVASVSLAVAGIVLVVVGILGAVIGVTFIASGLLALAIMFAGIGLTCFGILGAIFMGWAAKKSVQSLIQYGKWNVKVIEGGI